MLASLASCMCVAFPVTDISGTRSAGPTAPGLGSVMWRGRQVTVGASVVSPSVKLEASCTFQESPATDVLAHDPPGQRHLVWVR